MGIRCIEEARTLFKSQKMLNEYRKNKTDIEEKVKSEEEKCGRRPFRGQMLVQLQDKELP